MVIQFKMEMQLNDSSQGDTLSGASSPSKLQLQGQLQGQLQPPLHDPESEQQVQVKFEGQQGPAGGGGGCIQLSIEELNTNFSCKLCHGYYRDVHTIPDCLHSFCKVCLYKHVQQQLHVHHAVEATCPTCKMSLGSMPWTKVIYDRTLQQLVDKILPQFVEEDKKFGMYSFHYYFIISMHLSPLQKLNSWIELESTELQCKISCRPQSFQPSNEPGYQMMRSSVGVPPSPYVHSLHGWKTFRIIRSCPCYQSLC
jgi:hypothetical protein